MLAKTCYKHSSTVDLCLSNFCILEFLIFLYFDSDCEAEQYLNWRAGLVFLWFIRLPEDGTPEPEHIGVAIYNELYSVMCIYCILLRAYVG